ncbi:hypothetical protein DSO57_1001705 [Entomophthora muscae]|uniref:Uncharacterized protein n=1 Tax=Entomophthora muscae TaxID=34485 RepID=A0ACC2SLX0_9FUNG|nr:hypothetical protein DSO57_1001705 [Entomophthora muscae]
MVHVRPLLLASTSNYATLGMVEVEGRLHTPSSSLVSMVVIFFLPSCFSYQKFPHRHPRRGLPALFLASIRPKRKMLARNRRMNCLLTIVKGLRSTGGVLYCTLAVASVGTEINNYQQCILPFDYFGKS